MRITDQFTCNEQSRSGGYTDGVGYVETVNVDRGPEDNFGRPGNGHGMVAVVERKVGHVGAVGGCKWRPTVAIVAGGQLRLGQTDPSVCIRRHCPRPAVPVVGGAHVRRFQSRHLEDVVGQSAQAVSFLDYCSSLNLQLKPIC